MPFGDQDDREPREVRLMGEPEAKLSERSFLKLEPFGRALTASLENARHLPDGTAAWEEEDYCRPPLAREREAVLDLISRQ